MAYYHDLVTQKSWEELQRLRQITDFVLIGGWAVYLYTRALKSKDIDVVVDFDQLPALQKNYRLVKNDRLKKYEAIRDEVQIDIYLPHYSVLGMDVAMLQKQTQSVEGFTLLDSNYLATLKIHVLSQRARSAKGEKDFIDIIALVRSGRVDIAAVANLIKTQQLGEAQPMLLAILSEHVDVPELGMNQHAYSKIKKHILEGILY